MKLSRKASNTIFYALTACVIAVSVVCFAGAVSWVNKPFPGFLLYPDPLIGSFGSRDWPGSREGLRFLERIVAVDGEAAQSGKDVVSTARQRDIGTPVLYTVESGGRARDVKVPVHLFSIKDFLLIFLITFVGGLIFYALGFVVYVLKPNLSTSWVFLMATFGQAIYMLTGFEIQSTYVLVKLHYFILGIYPAFFFHLGLIFPERKRILNRFPSLEYLIYVPALILGIGFLVHYSTVPEATGPGLASSAATYVRLGAMTRVFMLFCFLSMIFFILHSYFRASAIQARQRAAMILFGVSIAAAPSVTLMALAYFLKIEFPWNFLVFFLIFFPASIAYSIVRHNLFDADAIIKRTVGYIVVTGIVVGAYIGVSVTLNVFVGKYQLAQSRAFPIVFTLGVILIFNPLRNRIQSLVDRLFFRKEYDYGVIVEKIGDAMTSLLELPEILKRLTQCFIEDMFINTSSVMLLSSAGTEYQVYIADGEKKEAIENKVIKRETPLIEIIEGEKRELTKYDVLEDPKYRSVSEICATDFEALNSSLMVPLVYQGRVIGSLNLGEKKSGKAYNREDIDLFRTLAHQGAVAIENARLFQENLEKQRMEEELNIARDLQMSMLPATCPKMRGFEISAASTPAREVGGDFYDFFKVDDEKLALIVGDVTGKSVSGALVMSAARSVFRMLSEQQLAVSDIMVRANRRMKMDIKSGMFVALLYAFLNAQEKSIRLCSAGQTQPIYFSAKTGEVRLVETEGDTFPLGILEEVDYMETQLQVRPGDRVIFYTDGIVEAMNKKEEIFGFDRLMGVIKEAGSMGADSLLKEILDRVSSFAGGAAQHDDLTVIVVSVEQEGTE
jgi:sigma-B regulation protein RsbU (phosphoserine phosphatase)